jgi:hypothetical protein
MASFAGFVAFSNTISSGLKTEINANLDLLAALIPADKSASVPASPDFNQMPDALGTQLRAEITALKAAVTAAS